MEQNDTYLLLRVVEHNDQHAYKLLYYRHFGSLHGFATSFVKNEELAEELVSDVFINVWKGREHMNSVKNLRVYLFVATKNLCIRALTKRGITINFGEEYFSELNAGIENPFDQLVSEELLQTLEKAVEELPERCRLIFRMVREEGLKYREVSIILNISIKTIEAQMSIATKRILKSLPDLHSIPGRQGNGTKK